MCTNTELQLQIEIVDKKLCASIEDGKVDMSALELKIENISKDVCGVKDDVAEVKKVLDSRVLASLKDHKQMLAKNNEELGKLQDLTILAPSIESLARNSKAIQDMVDNQKVMQKGSKWVLGFLSFVALVLGIIFTITRIISGRL
jgi:hypothetical protein